MRKTWRWDQLRAVGNSHVVKLSTIFPLLGYLILFNAEVVKFLDAHHFNSALDSADIVGALWRHKIQFLYFGFVFLGLGSLCYQVRCPSVVKKHSDWIDYVNADGDALSYKYLGELAAQFGIEYDRKTQGEDEASSVGSEIMRANFNAEINKFPKSRLTVAILFLIGFALLSIPSMISLFKILAQLLF